MKNSISIIAIILCFLLVSCERNESAKDSDGVTFTKIISETDGNYELDGNIVSYNEIEGYDSTKHIFLLTSKAGERIRSINYPVSPTRFAVAVDGELIYIANFIPGYSSMSCDECIAIEPYSYDNKYWVKLGYPGSNHFSGTDPRNDKRVIQRLKRDNKLIKITK